MATCLAGGQVGARGNTAESCLAESCLLGTQPQESPPGPWRVYLPLVIVQRQPAPPGCDVVEVEPDDTHTDAQALTSGCVAGDASWDGDQDWYRLDVCSQITRLVLRLHGPTGDNDLDLYLYGNPPGYPLYASEGIATSQEAITTTALITGTYYALIQPVEGSGDYVLNTEVTR